MAEFGFKTTYVVYAAPDSVFDALTDPGLITQWGGGFSVVEDHVGGHFEYFDGWIRGEVTHYVPGKELGFTWTPDEWDKRTKPSRVLLRLMPHAAGTDIVIEHSDFPSQEEADKHSSGWIDQILDPLNDFFIEQMPG
ncbi:MAG: SRPBCC domain-containing protein [Bacteroidota bacterium]